MCACYTWSVDLSLLENARPRPISVRQQYFQFFFSTIIHLSDSDLLFCVDKAKCQDVAKKIPTAEMDGQFVADVNLKASNVFVFVFVSICFYLLPMSVKCKHF